MSNTVENTYPTREQMYLQWKELAAEIIKEKSQSPGYPQPAKNKKGSLIIIGSGIQSLGFSMTDVKVMEDADTLFYCVADPATIVWIKKLRPDAYDLYTLYDDNKIRYYTYMQMTESMLYCLRQGKKVVAVFYGHPGIFVLSTHRAIAIAKREGLKAEMRPGVSALDCLCADLGVDPSHPGMVTYEATDMLIRLRKPDTSLHVILWQVGLIAEMGYRRVGFINNNFLILVEYLQKFYGEDYEIVHYIASRYPTIPPRIEKYKLDQLKDPRIRVKISGLSTFYIPPKDARQSDLDMCIQLGLVKPGQSIKPTGALREIDKYEHRELTAINLFENFSVPEEYQYQTDTPVAEFLIDLATDVQLQQRYTNEPEKLLSDGAFSHLSGKDKQALLSRDEAAIQIAAKGIKVRSSEQERFVLKVFGSQKLAKEMLETVRQFKRTPNLDKQLEALAQQNGFNLKWGNISSAVDNVYASSLLPWTGVYADEAAQRSIIVLGNGQSNNKSIIFIDRVAIKKFTFNNSTLMWRKDDGNDTNGWLQFYPPKQNDAEHKRKASGKTWTQEEPSAFNVEATELVVEKGFTPAMPTVTGKYGFRFCDEGWKNSTLNLEEDAIRLFGSAIKFTQKENDRIEFKSTSGLLYKGEITFIADPFTGLPSFFGTLQFFKDRAKMVVCYGSKIPENDAELKAVNVPGFPEWVVKHISTVNKQQQLNSGLLIYNHYSKLRFTGKVVTQIKKIKSFH